MMGVEEVRAFFLEKGLEYEIKELDESTDTVERAANALGVEPALIVEYHSGGFRGRDRPLIHRTIDREE